MPEVSSDLEMVRVTNEDFVKSRSTHTKVTGNGSSSGFYRRYRKNRRCLSGSS